tara:strand:- start:769 stop:1893 length:1125 start_codon:yes stop_codon:yes gene_type:complete
MDFINLQKQYQQIKQSIDEDILNIFEKGNYILGEEVFKLENYLADYVGVKECVTCASGTDALLIPLMAKNIKKGDAVFTTNFSYFATAEVISLVGAHPVFVDIDKSNFNIDPDCLENIIINTLSKGDYNPKAIIAVDLFGQPANYKKIKHIAKKYDLYLIEDAAQSFGATIDSQKSCSFGDVGATSFYPSKPLGCYGDGGAIFTNDSKMADIFRSIRVHGQGLDKYDNVRIGLNSRLDTIQAAVLLNKLEIFDDEILKRNEIADYYTKFLKEYLITPSINNGYISSWAQYSLLCNNRKERDDLVNFLNKKNIPTAIFYKNIFSNLKLYKKNYKDDFKYSEYVSKRILSIPMHPYLEKDEQNYIIESITEFYKEE